MRAVSAEELLRQLREEPRYRRELAEILASDPEIRLALIQGALREVATKQDIERLTAYIDSRISDVDKRLDILSARIDDVNRRIDDVNRRVDDLNGRLEDLSSLVRASLVAIVVTLASTILVPLALKLLLP
ncbi:hypothetical protein [Infirmifilum sp. NZ]|uniref:hypothetical protein n=1 Tax=Infirmifilum sp. NZ TaxID=2926850 RepID=UPI00279A0FAB|nr:hypothetical protein [Infirmifilum sp. NZ]UNQ73506.1 hypothetical protein MOV14_00485 [Infirmifilum sp. NZ]